MNTLAYRANFKVMKKMKCCELALKLHFRNIKMGPISESVTLHKARIACLGLTTL